MAVIILDRDGVINFDSADYIKSAAEWIPIPGSIEAINLLCRYGFRIYIATNQAGLARELFTLEDLQDIHRKLRSLVEAQGGKISGIFYCSHHPDKGCDCRKPGTGLLKQIASASGEDLRYQPFVGDSLKDIQAAIAMGCQPILVRTGNGEQTREHVDKSVPVFDNLFSFVTDLVESTDDSDLH